MIKISVNLLPETQKIVVDRTLKKWVLIIIVSLATLVLIFNLLIFGFDFYLKKTTQETLTAIKNREIEVASLSLVEMKYRSLAIKLLWLSSFWSKQINVEEIINFSQTLVIENTQVKKITFIKNSPTQLSMAAANSDAVEAFLNRIGNQQKNGRIKELKLVSLARNEKGSFDLKMSFNYLPKEK